MPLLLDLGHSRYKAAYQSGYSLEPREAFEAEDLDGLRNYLLRADIEHLYVTDAGERRPELRAAVAESWRGTLHVIDQARAAEGFTLHYDRPETFGVDRLCAMRAASDRNNDNDSCIVIDAGTAVTLDGVLPSGEHIGGWILPGLSTLDVALEHVLPRERGPVEAAEQDPLTIASTQEAMAAGAWNLLIGGVDRLCRSLLSGPLEGAPVFGSGGDISWIERSCETPFTTVPNLVIEGLARMAAADGLLD